MQTSKVTSSLFNPELGNLIYPKFNRFCEWVNGTEKVTSENGYSNTAIKTKGIIFNTAKALWPLHVPLQIIGLFSEKFNNLAKGLYGTCWPIIYSCYRPFAPNRRTLESSEAPSLVKSLFNANEHLRVWAGSLVSMFYGGSGLSMLFGAITGNSGLFEKASTWYQEWMLNQNFIFGVMNLNTLWLRKYSKAQVPEVHHPKNTGRAYAELFDSIALIPNAITRSLATFRSMGGELGETTTKIVDSLGFLNYGTWAYRFGDIKGLEGNGGDLDPLNGSLKEGEKTCDQFLYNAQKVGSKTFRFLLAPISFLAAGFRAFGREDLATSTFKIEGILEKLQTAIAAKCFRTTWFKWFTKDSLPTTHNPGSTSVEHTQEENNNQEPKKDKPKPDPTELPLSLLKRIQRSPLNN